MSTPRKPKRIRCPVCEELQQVRTDRCLYLHPGVDGPCPGGGRYYDSAVEMARTFASCDNPPGVRRAMQVIDNGDTVIVQSAVDVAVGRREQQDRVSAISVRINPTDIPRLLDQLTWIAEERGLTPAPPVDWPQDWERSNPRPGLWKIEAHRLERAARGWFVVCPHLEATPLAGKTLQTAVDTLTDHFHYCDRRETENT